MPVSRSMQQSVSTWDPTATASKNTCPRLFHPCIAHLGTSAISFLRELRRRKPGQSNANRFTPGLPDPRGPRGPSVPLPGSPGLRAGAILGPPSPAHAVRGCSALYSTVVVDLATAVRPSTPEDRSAKLKQEPQTDPRASASASSSRRIRTRSPRAVTPLSCSTLSTLPVCATSSSRSCSEP